MKVGIQIICKDQYEFDRAEQVICAILDNIRSGDVIDAHIVIATEDEGNAYAEK